MLHGTPNDEKVRVVLAETQSMRRRHVGAWQLTAHDRRGISNGVTTVPSLHIVLYQPEIPQNTGNIGRTCVAVGAKLWLVRPLGFQMDEKRVRRAGLDYWPHLDYAVIDSWDDLVASIPDFRPWFFTKSARRLYTDAPYSGGDALVFGPETSGLPASLLAAHSDRSVRIPIGPHVRSLNLSNAVAVAVYEALRQHEFDGIPPGSRH